eukprot:jgi/Bigna1/134428/aug1.25_g9136
MPRASGRIKPRDRLGLNDPVEDEPQPNYREGKEELTTGEQISAVRRDIYNTNEDTSDMLDAAIQTGANTNKQLVQQREQLRHAREDLDEVDENNMEAERQMNRLETCCCISLIIQCCCCCCIDNKPITKKKKAARTDKERDMKISKQEEERFQKQLNIARRRKDVQEAQNKEGLTEEERHEEVHDKQLDLLSAQLAVLNDVAQDTSEELKYQKDVVSDVSKIVTLL